MTLKVSATMPACNAETATEAVVKRARVTREALDHQFKDKQDLFKAVLHEEQLRLASETAEVASKESDPWRAMLIASNAFLDACLDPAVRQIVLLDAPAVLPAQGWREADQSYCLTGVKTAIQGRSMRELSNPSRSTPLAHMILGAFNEAALLIAHAQDKKGGRPRSQRSHLTAC